MPGPRLGSGARLLSVARKSLLELVREPQLLAMVLVFPLTLVVIYQVAFGRDHGGLSQVLHLQVLDEDAGTTVFGVGWNSGRQLREELRSLTVAERPVFHLEQVHDPDLAAIAVAERRVTGQLQVPAEFSHAIAYGTQAEPVAVGLHGDSASGTYAMATCFLEPLLGELARRTSGGQREGTVAWEFIGGEEKISDFDAGVPGLLVFGMLLLVVTTATALVREQVAGTLQRLRMTHLRAADLPLGVGASQAVVAAVQLPLVFALAWAFGFRCAGSLVLAMGIVLLLGVGVIGLGLCVAAVAHDDGQATYLGALTAVPMAFLSGSLVPMPQLVVARIGAVDIGLFDLLPASHAVEALRGVMVHGASLHAVQYELAALGTLSSLLLGVGAAAYARTRMRGAHG
jgi:ABC-2 type transport system permease protein